MEVIQTGMTAATKWSEATIFERMGQDNMSEDGISYRKDYQSNAIPITDIPFKKDYTQKPFGSTKIEKILLGENESSQTNRWVKFFANKESIETEQDFNEADFYNVAAVVYKMYEQSGFISLNGNYYPTDKDAFIKLFSEDFKQGIYVNNYGVKCQGVYKFYFEPTTLLRIDSSGAWYAMTLRDIIAYQNAIKEVDPNFTWGSYATLSSIGRGGCLTLGNSTYLVRNEPVLNMQGNTLGKAYTNSDVYNGNTGVDGFGSDKPFYQGAGVGVITGAPHGPIAPEVKVVTSYIKITGYNEKGEAYTIPQAGDTVIAKDGRTVVLSMNQVGDSDLYLLGWGQGVDIYTGTQVKEGYPSYKVGSEYWEDGSRLCDNKVNNEVYSKMQWAKILGALGEPKEDGKYDGEIRNIYYQWDSVAEAWMVLSNN